MARFNKTETDQFQKIQAIFHKMVEASLTADRKTYNSLVEELKTLLNGG